jgi:hypothetical protein
MKKLLIAGLLTLGLAGAAHAGNVTDVVNVCDKKCQSELLMKFCSVNNCGKAVILKQSGVSGRLQALEARVKALETRLNFSGDESEDLNQR